MSRFLYCVSLTVPFSAPLLSFTHSASLYPRLSPALLFLPALPSLPGLCVRLLDACSEPEAPQYCAPPRSRCLGATTRCLCNADNAWAAEDNAFTKQAVRPWRTTMPVQSRQCLGGSGQCLYNADGAWVSEDNACATQGLSMKSFAGLFVV